MAMRLRVLHDSVPRMHIGYRLPQGRAVLSPDRAVVEWHCHSAEDE